MSLIKLAVFSRARGPLQTPPTALIMLRVMGLVERGQIASSPASPDNTVTMFRKWEKRLIKDVCGERVGSSGQMDKQQQNQL